MVNANNLLDWKTQLTEIYGSCIFKGATERYVEKQNKNQCEMIISKVVNGDKVIATTV